MRTHTIKSINKPGESVSSLEVVILDALQCVRLLSVHTSKGCTHAPVTRSTAAVVVIKHDIVHACMTSAISVCPW